MASMLNKRRFFLASLCFLAPILAFANPFEHQLKNGLRVIVKEDNRAPAVVHMVWYRVGSMDEVNGTTGVAHALEHMMFKGTPTIGAGEFSRRVAAAGGRDNAFTSRDYTAYFQQIPNEKLPEMMRLEADRMNHLKLDPKEFAQEIKVIMEERRLRTDDQPSARLFEQTISVAFQAHPYRVPVIGWMSDLENMTAGDLRAWYQRWVVPNNAHLVVVGDVKHQEVFKLAEKFYGSLKARALPTRKAQDEPPQVGMRRLTVKAPADLPILLMAYKVPVIRDVENDVDPYALEILAAILDGHDGARFTKNLIREKRLAVAIGTGYDSSTRGPGLFYLQAMPALTPTQSQDQSMAALEAALREEINTIARDGISADELARVRAQVLAAQTYKRDSMFAQALEIGQLESVGIPYSLAERLTEKLQAVRAEDVQAVAKKYFGEDGLTVGVLDPQPLPEKPLRKNPPSENSSTSRTSEH